jgi:Mu-like prophage FluMu N-terminal domain
MAQTVTIVSRVPGFRRAGMAHPNRAEYPASAFTPEQLALLQAEPMLEVIITGDPDPAPAKTKG